MKLLSVVDLRRKVQHPRMNSNRVGSISARQRLVASSQWRFTGEVRDKFGAYFTLCGEYPLQERPLWEHYTL
jgi:hypothetical protein